jgi:hypothetical protein
MKKWNIYKAALIGLAIGFFGTLADTTRNVPPVGAAQILRNVVEIFGPAVLFALVAWIQNRFTKG